MNTTTFVLVVHKGTDDDLDDQEGSTLSLSMALKGFDPQLLGGDTDKYITYAPSFSRGR